VRRRPKGKAPSPPTQHKGLTRRSSMSDFDKVGGQASKPNTAKRLSAVDPKECMGATVINRVPISPEREPDPSQLPYRVRKLHGKTHPLTRLAGEVLPAKGRTNNPVYNTM